jgi:glycogen(starch) synthase
MNITSGKSPKVLMLGWEFPPIISGGLGVACLGLAKALSKHAELTIILPKSDPNFVVENVELIGLNNIEIEKLRNIRFSSEYNTFAETESVTANINAYDSALMMFDSMSEVDIKIKQEERKRAEQMGRFNIGDLYGDDVVKNVKEFSRYAVQLALKKDFDIIYCHDWMTFLAGIEIKTATGKPLVLHVHSLEFDRNGPYSQGWVYQLEKYAMEWADAVIPVSHYTGSIAENHYGICADKIYPVHNGAEPVKVFNDAKHFPEKLIVFLGRVTGQKGPQFFLDIAHRVIEKTPDVRFVMAGTGDRLRGLIETGAYKNIGTKFHFTGFLNKEKVHKLLSMADVYCMPSVSEPFGLSALEAAQFGVPCVISKQSGVAEVLSGALKSDYWDVNKMSDQISSLLMDDTLRKSVIKKSFKDLERCSWNNAAEKIVNVCSNYI